MNLHIRSMTIPGRTPLFISFLKALKVSYKCSLIFFLYEYNCSLFFSFLFFEKGIGRPPGIGDQPRSIKMCTILVSKKDQPPLISLQNQPAVSPSTS